MKWKRKDYPFADVPFEFSFDLSVQLITGLTKPTSGSIYIQRYSNDGSPNQPPVLLSPERVGIVFQFPERYFVADYVFDGVTFGLPRQNSVPKIKELIARRLERAITSVFVSDVIRVDPMVSGCNT
ncbi:hypothetical protein L6452_18306 [Arctium lappa]|uniref:Uncharacterized protein n=1 Tax=Arctium lappa TaxID=4217 RepID=A0ACB9C5S7_ARCLA|nr:hypothetical protein L6452_18306 [Arctium lappa]